MLAHPRWRGQATYALLPSAIDRGLPWVVSFLTLQPAAHSSREQALGGSQCLPQGALLTSGTGWARCVQAPVQQAVTKTKRNPGPTCGALVTRQALCTYRLISSSQRLPEASSVVGTPLPR